MLSDEKKLLMMVAQDLQKLWKTKPETFGSGLDLPFGHMRAMDYERAVQSVKQANNDGALKL